MQFDNASPIWTQLVTEFSRRIAVGEWEAGVKIPGVRDLAVALGVNPNTVQRALSELERQGLCQSARTAGRFVTENDERINDARFALAASAADEFTAKARGLRLNQDSAVDLVKQRWDTAEVEKVEKVEE